jgi:hypothetical protein
MRKEDVKAVITESWDHPNCKFRPGDKVGVVIDGQDSYPASYNKYHGRSGTVYAATCGPDGRLRSRKTTWYGRQYTKYFVEFQDGTVYGLHSHHLEKLN